jgi:hypothetical protein
VILPGRFDRHAKISIVNIGNIAQAFSQLERGGDYPFCDGGIEI